MIYCRVRVIICFIVSLISFKSAHCQIDQNKLDELKERYPWGSIYVTYSSFINLRSILQDANKSISLKERYTTSAMSSLQSFFEQHKNPKGSESIAFIEIDLNRVEAGFKKANDLGGEITTISWSKKDVVKIADLCDRQLIAIANVKHTLDLITADSISIQTAFENVNKIRDDVIISEETYFLLANDFRFLIAKKNQADIAALNPDIQSNIAKFVTDFDKKYFELNNFNATEMFGKDQQAKNFSENFRELQKSFKDVHTPDKF